MRTPVVFMLKNGGVQFLTMQEEQWYVSLGLQELMVIQLIRV